MFKFLKKKGVDNDFYAFAKGTVVTLDKVPDQVFAQKLMGDGFAIELIEGKIYAPVSGELKVVFPTGHAYGSETKAGLSILIHIGIDTVELDGKGFLIKVKQGDTVKRGNLLAEVDLDYLKDKNKPTITPLIFTSGEKIKLLSENKTVTKDDKNLFEFI